MDNIFEKIPIKHPSIKTHKWGTKQDIKLDSLHEVSKSLNDVEAMINEEPERQNNEKYRKYTSNLNFSIVETIVFMMSITAFYALYKCQKS